ncbi:ABC transporter permease subunit [Alkaliphilus transvaalensis]|uniref:ABC transporter permease subunit n=1 Tax=Alkaliphilus transvaalensis TaxID=114628 RepID=UPI00047B532D|nr:ABC transporter permease subunit [Alkaliphilus transvaalensis]
MNKMAIRKISIKVTTNLLMLFLIGLIVVLLTNVPLDLNFFHIDGKLVSNMDYSLYQENVLSSIKNLVSGSYLQIPVTGRGQTVGAILLIALKRSMTLFFIALVVSLLIGIPKGIFDSRRQKKQSTFKFLQTIIPLSVPDVLLISLIQLLGLYLYRRNITLLGIGPVLHLGYAHWSQAIYPTIALSLVPAAYIARITATSIEAVYDKDYILAARGKGCSETRIILNHAMRNVWVDLIASFPTITSMMFSSLFIVERIFYYPGIAFEMIELYGRPTDVYLMGGRVADTSITTAFLAFAVTLALIYFILYTILDIVRQVLVPKLKNQ